MRRREKAKLHFLSMGVQDEEVTLVTLVAATATVSVAKVGSVVVCIHVVTGRVAQSNAHSGQFCFWFLHIFF